MKTVAECIAWIDFMTSRGNLKPNIEDMNYWKAIKHYLRREEIFQQQPLKIHPPTDCK